MKRFLQVFSTVALLGTLSATGWAAGSADRLYGYALAGANPRAVFVVIDSNGNGVKGVPLTVTCTAGTLDVVSGSTGADGTFTVNQSGAALGSQIIATVAVSHGSPFTITTANGADRVDVADPTYFWFDESRRLVNLVSVTSGKGVLTLPTKSSFRFYPEDHTTNGRDISTSQNWNIAVQQTTTGPIQVEVYQGTFQNGDDMKLYDSFFGRWLDPNGNGFGEIFFSANPPAHYLNAYAVDGASPTVCAVVTDTNGVGVPGVTVSVTATAGTFPALTAVTGDSGRAYFYQQDGVLGNTITVSCAAYTETSPVAMISQASQTLQTTDRLFSWFSRSSRKIYTAVVNRQSNVLVTSVLAPTWYANYFTNSADPNQRPAESTTTGVFTDQTSMQPAMAAVPHGATVAGDVFYLYNLPNLYHYNYYQCALVLPAAESQYLLAFASGGANPTIWAAVTDGTGNAVKGVTVNFSLQGSGSLAAASGATSWSGLLTNSLTGAASTGNTITVSAAGLGSLNILTSDSQAVTASDRVYGWYDPETHKIIGAVVTLGTNVMTSPGTAVGGSTVKRTSGNNTPNLGYALANEQNTPQSATQPFMGHVGFGTINAGDFIRLTQNGTVNTYDTHIIAAADPAKFLVAFAKGGVNPDVYAVVMDNQGNGLENQSVTFASPYAGTMSQGTTVTGFGGFVTAAHTSALLGNTLTVSAPGLPPVTIYTANAPPAGGHGDNGVAWYDASRLTIWGISFDDANHVVLSSQSWYDWNGYSPQGPYVVSSSAGLKINKAQAYDFTRKINPLAQWSIAYGSATAGDEAWVDLGLIKSYLHLGSVRSSYLRACASPGANPSRVRAVVADAHGVGLPNMAVTFTSSGGSMGGTSWTTGLDGSVYAGQSSGALGDVITVSSPGHPDVQIFTNASNIVAANSPSVFWYDPSARCLNALMVQQPWHNVVVTTQANILFAASDKTANHKTLAVSGAKEDLVQSPTYGYAAPGTSGAGDQIVVQNNTVWGTTTGILTLPAELPRTLSAFAAGGLNPQAWAVVTDANGNGVGGVPVRFLYYPGPVTVNLVTETDGVTTNAHAMALGGQIGVAADSISNTIAITTGNPTVDSYARSVGWFDEINRTGYAAALAVSAYQSGSPNHVLASGTSLAETAVDTTPNGLTFALNTPVPQTAAAPASVQIVNGTQGQGDIIEFDESTATAAPDLQLSINVPASGIYSALVAGPDPVVNGNHVSVTMTVFNNGTPDALSVSPTALSVLGGAAYVSGPTPAFEAIIPGGQSKTFHWTYRAIAPGGVTFTGQALGVDAYTLNNLTSTASNANPVLVRNPVPPAITSVLAVPGTPQLSHGYMYVTLTVTNNSAAEVGSPLNVSPTALTVLGSANLISGPVPPNFDIPGQGGSHDFVWEYQLMAPTGVTLTGQAVTLNPFDHTGVTATAANVFVAVRDPYAPVIVPALSATPSVRTVGQTFTATLSVTNASDPEVGLPLTVTPSALAVQGPAVWVAGPTPAAWSVPRGETRDFVWTYATTAPGSVTLTGRAYTVNPFDASGVTSTAVSSNAVLAQSEAALTAGFSGPVQAERNQNFNLVMTLHNTGQATALAVAPVNVTSTGTGLAVLVSS
ncbi:MAG: hypothetical protein HGA76_05065, partial [Candidatus Firestonebacteria bacterium]|nr:hypothetical protein [Candidatus Firestonebacteria bacterium]